MYYPIIWSVLKTYCDKSDELREKLCWYEPIYEFNSPKKLLSPYHGRRIDVLALSCYAWNWELQLEIARIVKSEHPDCIVVVGGPQPEYKDKTFFKRYPYIDYLCPHEGEEPFRDLVLSLIGGGNEKSIPGLLSSKQRDEAIFTPGARTDLSAANYKSPWLSEQDYWKKIKQKHGAGRVHVAYSASRGCPYSCRFCDWGGLTMSKTVLVDIGIIKKELEFIINELQPCLFFLTDANFGISDRDVELAEYISEIKQKSNYPKYVYYSPSKNRADTNLRIADILYTSKVTSGYSLSLQHLDGVVINKMKRRNLPQPQLSTLINELNKRKIPITVQLIAGAPGDTIEKWKSLFYELMEMNIHSEYRVYPYAVLPNAQAASEEYISENKIKLFHALCETFRAPTDNELKPYFSKSVFIKESESFSEKDYIHMLVFSAFIQACHNSGFTRIISIILHYCYGVKFKQFYEELFMSRNSIAGLSEGIEAIENRITSWVDEKVDQLPVAVGKNSWLDMDTYLCWFIHKNFEQFYRDIKQLLAKKNIDMEIVNFQKSSIFNLDYNPLEGKRVSLQRPWFDWYYGEFLVEVGRKGKLPGIPDIQQVEYRIFDRTMKPGDESISWHAVNGEQNKLRCLVNETHGINFSRADKMFHKEFQIISRGH